MSRVSLLRRATRAHQQGQRHLWVVCFASRRVVGRREPGMTSQLARSIARSKSQVENYARAGVLHQWLRQHAGVAGIVPEFRQVRDRLSVSHFVLVADRMYQLEFPLWEAFAHLQVAAEEGLSVAALGQLIDEKEYGVRPLWVASRARLLNAALEIQGDQSTPEYERFIAGVVLTLARGGVE